MGFLNIKRKYLSLIDHIAKSLIEKKLGNLKSLSKNGNCVTLSETVTK